MPLPLPLVLPEWIERARGEGNEVAEGCRKRETERERENAPINDAHALTAGHARLQYYLLFMLSYAKPVHGYHRLASGHGLPYVCRYRHRPAYLYQLRVVPAALGLLCKWLLCRVARMSAIARLRI